MSRGTTKFFGPGDAPERPLQGERVAVLGYGNLGRAVALNLRDAGLAPTVGNRDDEYAARARDDGFEVVDLDQAAAADVVVVLLPDEVVPEVFATVIGPALRPGSAIAFPSGYCLAFRLIDRPPGVDVLLVAPRMTGEAVRERVVAGEGFWAYVGVEADASGRARERMLGLASAMGALRWGAVEVDAKTEAVVDLFVEQTVGPLLGLAITSVIDIGAHAGIPPEVLVLELYMSGELEALFESFRKRGLYAASGLHGPTALYGGLLRVMELDRAALVDQFEGILDDIQSGGFAQRFQAERKAGYPMLEMARVTEAKLSTVPVVEAIVRRRGG